MELSIIGDVMLGRQVRKQYGVAPYELVSDPVRSVLCKSDYVLANLESPITDDEELHSLTFAGDYQLLECFKWVSCFSLSNNHINDFGERGMKTTIESLERFNIGHNGLFVDDYQPYLINAEDSKIAVITCTDMINIEFSDDNMYKTFRVDDQELYTTIEKYNKLGFFVIVYAHCGSLFSRFPNPQIRIILHKMIDAGAHCLVTAHSHCLGGMDSYKGVPIFYSLGDFLMDGASYRRRESCILSLTIEGNVLKRWCVIPTITDKALSVRFPSTRKKAKMLNSFNRVSTKIRDKSNYSRFYNRQYKYEMFSHSLSTLYFIYDTKGIGGFIKVLMSRITDVKMMLSRMIKGRANMRYDSDAVGTRLKSINNE